VKPTTLNNGAADRTVTSVAPKETIAFLVTSHSRTEKYLPLVRSLLATFWPEHPQCLFLTDGTTQAADDVLNITNVTWTELFVEGLARIKRERPLTKYVFHMLEDHCPLRRCDAERLERTFAISARYDLAAVAYPTYSWPWDVTDPTQHFDGLVRTWHRKDIVEFDGELLAVVPSDFFRYFQVQPTLWRLDYLQAACAKALAMRITDAWGFEAMRWPHAEQHYVSRYSWPTVHHGFLAQGRVNALAVTYLDRKRAPGPHRTLVRDAIRIESPALFDSIQMLIGAKRSIRHTLAGVKKRLMALKR
jgi:hypothetical protein